MATISPSAAVATTNDDRKNGSLRVPLILILFLYFGIGFITSMNDLLIPHFRDLFRLTNVLALMVQFAFFGAYFIASIPSGRIVTKYGPKRGITIGLCVMGLGLLLFLPASIIIFYPMFLGALFAVGCGLALLQVAVNPYLSVLGPPETAASRLNLAGGFNSLATTIAPRVGGMLLFAAAGTSTIHRARSVRLPYITLSALAFLLAIVTQFVRLPTLMSLKDGGSQATKGAWRFRHLRLGAIAIFSSVGAEVAIGSVLIGFLALPSMGAMDHALAAKYLSLYWGGAMIGRFIGYFALRRISAPRALAFVSACAFGLTGLTICSHGTVSRWAIISCGLFNSVMWPCIFPLALDGLETFTSQGSGILITMVVGGAIVPEIQGVFADKFGYQRSFAIVLLCYAYLIYFSLAGHRNIDRGIPAELFPPGLV